MLQKVRVELVLVFYLLFDYGEGNPCDDDDGAAPHVVGGEFQGEKAHRYNQVEEQIEDHVVGDNLAYLAAALEYLEVHEDEIIFVNSILDPEEEGSEEGDQRH